MSLSAAPSSAKPKVFLLDEPLSNLDAKLRAQMRTEISKLHARLATTFIYVTHDQIEAMTMGTRIVVMKDGFMQQVDTPQNLYDYPINLFVAGFIGTPQMNFFPATLTQENGKTYVEFVNNKILLPKTVQARIRNIEEYANTGKPITLASVPKISTKKRALSPLLPTPVIKAFVEVVEKLGAETLIYCKLDFKEGEEVSTVIGDSSNMIAKIDSRSVISRGEITELAIDARHIHIFDGATEMSLLARDEGLRSHARKRDFFRVRASDSSGNAGDHRKEQGRHQGRKGRYAPRSPRRCEKGKGRSQSRRSRSAGSAGRKRGRTQGRRKQIIFRKFQKLPENGELFCCSFMQGVLPCFSLFFGNTAGRPDII